MSKRIRSLRFVAILCLVCSLLLTGASSGLKTFQEQNMVIDKQKNILKSVGLILPDKDYSQAMVQKMYQQNINAYWLNSEGRLTAASQESESLPFFVYKSDDEIRAYILPIDSRGLWGPIHGYMALEPDGVTISGFTIYKHSETPGLGGEIESAWFQKNFVGKKIVDQDGAFVSIAIVKGSVGDSVPASRRLNYVDGISGATMTGNFLTGGLRDTLGRYEPMSIKFRQKKVRGMPFLK